jgi:hypothetical protein
MTPLDAHDAMNAAIRAAARRGTAPPPETIGTDLPTSAGEPPERVTGSADQGARSIPPAPENPLQQAVRAWRNREGEVTP